MTSKDELACVYASLILMDDDVPVTAEKISTILKAAGVSVEPYWPGLFAKAGVGLDLKSITSNIGAAGMAVGGGGSATAAPSSDAPSAPKAEKKEEKKEEPEEESDEDMGFGLFD